MDSGDLEKERGITILSKCTALRWDVPGRKEPVTMHTGPATRACVLERTLVWFGTPTRVFSSRDGTLLVHADVHALSAMLSFTRAGRLC